MFRRIHQSQKNSANLNDHNEMQSLPTRPGCYAVMRDKQVLYVAPRVILENDAVDSLAKGDSKPALLLDLPLFVFFEYILISFLAPKDNCHGKYNKFPTICAWNCKFREELDI